MWNVQVPTEIYTLGETKYEAQNAPISILSTLEPPPRGIPPSIPKVHTAQAPKCAVSTAERVCLVAIRPADAHPDEKEQLDEKAEP